MTDPKQVAEAVTEADLELLRDKYVVWDRAARQVPMDMRDYNRRAADAIRRLLAEHVGLTTSLASAQRELGEAREFLAIFLGQDDRFQVSVGGNPNVVDAMLARARRTLEGK